MKFLGFFAQSLLHRHASACVKFFVVCFLSMLLFLLKHTVHVLEKHFTNLKYSGIHFCAQMNICLSKLFSFNMSVLKTYHGICDDCKSKKKAKEKKENLPPLRWLYSFRPNSLCSVNCCTSLKIAHLLLFLCSLK